jgi:hypothetical protein
MSTGHVALMLVQQLLAQQNAKPPRPGDWAFGWGSVGIIAAVAAAVVLIFWMISRVVAAREQKSKHSPWSLWKELADAHALSARERQLVCRLAKHLRLVQPTALFVEPSSWEVERLGPSWVACRPEIEKLRKRLFAVR